MLLLMILIIELTIDSSLQQDIDSKDAGDSALHSQCKQFFQQIAYLTMSIRDDKMDGGSVDLDSRQVISFQQGLPLSFQYELCDQRWTGICNYAIFYRSRVVKSVHMSL